MPPCQSMHLHLGSSVFGQPGYPILDLRQMVPYSNPGFWAQKTERRDHPTLPRRLITLQNKLSLDSRKSQTSQRRCAVVRREGGGEPCQKTRLPFTAGGSPGSPRFPKEPGGRARLGLAQAVSALCVFPASCGPMSLRETWAGPRLLK